MYNWDFILENEIKIVENNLINTLHLGYNYNYRQRSHYGFLNSFIEV